MCLFGVKVPGSGIQSPGAESPDVKHVSPTDDGSEHLFYLQVYEEISSFWMINDRLMSVDPVSCLICIQWILGTRVGPSRASLLHGWGVRKVTFPLTEGDTEVLFSLLERNCVADKSPDH